MTENSVPIIDEDKARKLGPGSLLIWSKYLKQLSSLRGEVEGENAFLDTKLHANPVQPGALPNLLQVVASITECEVRCLFEGTVIDMYELYQ